MNLPVGAAEIWTDPKFLREFGDDLSLVTPTHPEEIKECAWIRNVIIDHPDTSFTFVELGAGFGRWSMYAIAVAQECRPDITVFPIMVEAEPTHYRWLREHMRNNGVTEYRVFNNLVSSSRTYYLFQTGKPGGWYGQSIMHRPTVRSLVNEVVNGRVPRFVRSITLTDVLRGVERADLIDLDIQGEELAVLSSTPVETLNRIRRLYIGTHSPEIEDGLRELFAGLGWTCEFELPQDPPHDIIDGIQVWRNPVW